MMTRQPVATCRWIVCALTAIVCSALPATAFGQFNAYWLYSGRRGTTVIAPPAGPGPLDPLSVSARFGFLPYPIIARQPIGHQVLATGPNSYAYRPVYADDQTAASIALSDAETGSTDAGFLATHRAGDRLAGGAAGQPLVGIAEAAAAGGPAEQLSAALDEFRAARYPAALERLRSIGPADEAYGSAQMLAAEAHVALTDYHAAVTSLAAGMDALLESQWDRYVRDYRDYFASAVQFLVHLRSLERFVQQHPANADSHLLLGFHYAALGFVNDGLEELALAGDDPLARRLELHFRQQKEPPAPALDLLDEPDANAKPRRGREF